MKMNVCNVIAGIMLFGASIEAIIKGNYKMAFVYFLYGVTTVILSFVK